MTVKEGVAAERLRSNCGLRAAELAVCCNNMSALEELVVVDLLQNKMFVILFKYQLKYLSK